MEARAVAASRGWGWIADGFGLFRRSPLVWTSCVLILYVVLTLLARISILGVVFLLFLPVLLAGLMQGCRAIEAGEQLKITHLLSGFQKNAAHLVTLGGISLVGNLLLVMILVMMSGDAVTTVMKQAPAGAVDAAAAEAILRAAPRILTAALVVMTLSLPLLMGLWFAPLLVYFDGLSPVRALIVSFWACWKNMLPFLVYGVVAFAGIVLLVPFTLAFRQPDLSLWLLMPVLIPSIYCSYKDVFMAAPAPAAGGSPLLK